MSNSSNPLEKKAEESLEKLHSSEHYLEKLHSSKYDDDYHAAVTELTLEPFFAEFQKPFFDIIRDFKSRTFEHMNVTNAEEIDIEKIGAKEVCRFSVFGHYVYEYEYKDKKLGKVKCSIFSCPIYKTICEIESKMIKFSAISLPPSINLTVKCKDGCYEIISHANKYVSVNIDKNSYTNHYLTAIGKETDIDFIRDNLLLIIPEFSENKEVYESMGFTQSNFKVNEETHSNIAKKLGILPSKSWTEVLNHVKKEVNKGFFSFLLS